MYTFCDGKPTDYCPAAGLCVELRATMWDGAIASVGHESETGHREAVMAAISEAAIEAGLEASDSDVARLAMSSMYIAAGNCPHDKLTLLRTDNR